MAAVVAAPGVATAQAAAEVEAPVPVFERQIGSSGHAGLYGWGAATMLDGSVLISDYWNLRVQRFAPDGTFIETFIENAGYGPDQHQAPYGLAVDPRNGDVYMADTDRRGIDKYDADGNFLLSFGSQGSGVGQFRYPSRVAVGSDGRTYVADTWSNEIVVHDDQGTELFTFGGAGTALGRLKQPHGLSFDDQDRLFVVDTNNHRVQVFDADGLPLYAFGSQGAGPGQFAGDMRGIAVDSANGWVYVVDGEGNRVSKFTLDGTFLTRWGSNGTAPGQFHDGGREVTVDHQGKVWVAEMPGFRAQVFSPDGVYLFQVPDGDASPPEGGFNGPRDAAVDSHGNVFVSDTYNFRMQKLDPDGTPLAVWGRRGRGDYEFNYTRYLATDPRDDSVVIADTDNNRIKKYDQDGTFVWEVGGLGAQPGQFRNPIGVDIGPDGTIYVVDTNNDRVQVFDADGTPLLAFGSDGTGNGQFRYPRGVARAPDGTIWVADSTRGVIQQFAADGTWLQSIGTPGDAEDQLRNPNDLVVTDDWVIVSDPPTHLVKVFATDGTHLTSFGGWGSKPGQLHKPMGLDLVGTTLYVTEVEGERISVFELDGGEPDVQAPDAVFTTPSAGNDVLVGTPTDLVGTATDDVALLSVEVAIKDRTQPNRWYHGDGTWGSYRRLATVLADEAATSTTWTASLDLPDGSYGGHVVATDLAGNVDGQLDWQTFTVQQDPGSADEQAPTVDSDPANNAVLDRDPLILTGSASDDVGVESVLVSIQDRASKQWVQPDGSLGPYVRLAADVDDPGGTDVSWTLQVDVVPAGGYGFGVLGVDAAGNESARPWKRFEAA